MSIVARLGRLLGEDQMATEPETCSRLGQDLFPDETMARVVAVVSPRESSDVAEVVGEVQRAGCAMAVRGGGMSYTSGFPPDGRESVLVDLSELNRVRQIDTGNRLAIVEAGVTWEQLDRALEGTGLRSSLRGPISGSVSTVGGALSQNLPGSMDAVLGLEMVCAAHPAPFWTGSAAAEGRLPFYRGFGPDLTGLFLGDGGALGVKTAAALRLEAAPEGVAHGSFAFDTMAEAADAMAAVMQVATPRRLFALDPLKNKTSTKVGVREGLSTLARVVKSGGVVKGGADATRIAVAGRAAFDDVQWSVHMSFEGPTQSAADETLRKVKDQCVKRGRPIGPSIPVAMHARPYSVRGFLGINGERWVPLHGIFPLSQIKALIPAVEHFFLDRREQLMARGIVHSFMLAAGPGYFLVEPMFYWPDELLPAHRTHLHTRQLAKIREHKANPAARELVRETRIALRELFAEFGAVASQLGRFYPYRELLSPGARQAFDAIKQALDPQQTLNPGVLGTSEGGEGP